MGDRPRTTPLYTTSSIKVPDTYANNLEILEADEKVKRKSSKTLAITDTQMEG